MSFSPDGSRIVSRDDDETIRIWDAKTGKQLSIEKVWPEWAIEPSNSGSISSDGNFICLGQSSGRIIRVPLKITPEELQFRKLMWRPDPIWHRERLEEAKKSKDKFAEKVQNYLLHKAVCEEHFDNYRWDQALSWSIAAVILKPKPPIIDWPKFTRDPWRTLPTRTELRLRDMVRGESMPTSNADRLEYAQHAYFSQRFTLATRLWSEALTIDPKLTDDPNTGHRYNAACCAALASDGQSRDEPSIDDMVKGKLRSQTIDWLKAELTLWSQLLEADPILAPTIVRIMNHWQKDTDLASIRDEKALAKLPAEEQKAFTQLWADVATLLKKAQAKPAKK